MSVDARKEEYEFVELFGKPALFTNARIQTDSVPEGWFCYDLRGSDDDPGQPVTLEILVVVNHAGTILTQENISFPKGKNYLPLGEGLNFLGGHMDLAAFCEEYGLSYPAETRKYIPRPAAPEERDLFFALPPEQDAELGAIGHVRMDFGHRGEEFWHTWWPRGPEELNSQEFKEELTLVVNELRTGPLKSLKGMKQFCWDHGGEIEGGICTQNYGYIIETERYRYCLRCNPFPGDYQAYLTCFDKRVQEMNMAQKAGKNLVGRVSFANGDVIEYTDPAEYLKAIREEIPYHATSGFRYETLTDDPQVRKAADDALYDLYGEGNPKELKDYDSPRSAMEMEGM